jgi:nuclear pore complex protein Nup98-Nup96
MFNRFSSTTTQPAQASNTSFFGATPTAQTASPFGGSFASQPPAAPSTPYTFTNELENGITIKLLSISAMPAYRHLSQEEIRVDDYAKGRKGPSSFPGSQPGAFSTSFSNNATSTSNRFPYSSTSTSGTGAFGSSAFGSSVAPSASTTSGTGLFGGPGAFGATAPKTSTTTPSTGFGSFGSSSAAPQAGSAFGSTPFGSSTGNLGGFGSTGSTGFSSSTVGPFGSSAPSTSTGGFGSFGVPSTAPTTTTAQSTSGFGSSPFGSFGSTTQPPLATTGLFGSSTPSTSGGLFGQTSQNQQQLQQSSFGGFGQQQQTPSTGLFGAKPSTVPSTGLFGSTMSTNAGFGGFGQPQTQQQQPHQSGFGGFGQPQQQPQQQQQSAQGSFGGMFGSSNTPSSASTASGTGLFGSSTAPSSGSLFGSSAQPNQQQQSTGMFGSSTSGGLFGQPQQQQQSSSLFRPAAPTQSTSQFAFGSSAPNSTTPLLTSTSTSLFGTSGGLGGGMVSSSNLFNRPTSTVGTSGTGQFGIPSINTAPITTSISGTPALNLPMVAPATISSGSLSLAPPLPSIYAKSSSHVPGHETARTIVTAPKSPVKFTPRTSFRIKPRESYGLTAPIPINFGTGPSLGSSTGSTVLVPRKMVGNSLVNMKKLVIPDFNESHEVTSTNVLNAQASFSTPAPSTPSISNSSTSTTGNILTDSMAFGQQYTFPPIKILKSLPALERKEIKNFVIGQKGIGEIRFLVPVDLSEIDVERIFGHLIEFCEGEAVLYPDPSIPKPEPGQGLNLPAQVRLERIWTMSKGSRDPIVDPENEKVILFTQKLKEAEGTNFISYNPSTGNWTFTVDHF